MQWFVGLVRMVGVGGGLVRLGEDWARFTEFVCERYGEVGRC